MNNEYEHQGINNVWEYQELKESRAKTKFAWITGKDTES
jgi:hypothetical protein